jgi:hypothetical protein
MFCIAASFGKVIVGNVVADLVVIAGVCDTVVRLIVAQPPLKKTIRIIKHANNVLNLIVNIGSF